MKQIKFTTLLLLIGAFFIAQPSYAMFETHNTTSTALIEKQKNDLKKEFKVQKRVAKFEKLFKKAGIDFQDPVEKWLWYGIFGCGAAVVLSILWRAGTASFGLLGALSSLLLLAGIICLVIWVVKKFA